MPKAKTRRIVLKRYKFTKTGKIKRKHSRTSHRKRIDSSNTTTRKKRVASVSGKIAKKLKEMIVTN